MHHTRYILKTAAIAFTLSVHAQITITDVPVDSCAGSPTGTATFSTDLTIPTGSQRIPAGDFWEQQGAQWVFSTDTEGIQFSDLAIPGAGAPSVDVPQENLDALKVDDSKTAWTLAAPSPTNDRQLDIVFQAANPAQPDATNHPVVQRNINIGRDAFANGQVTKGPSPIPAPMLKRRISPGAKFRRQDTGAGSFHLTIEATFPCANDPAFGLSPSETFTGSPNPTVAALCSANKIPTDAAAWSAYKVNDYASSLLRAAAPAPTAPQVDGAELMKNEVGAADECIYTSKCTPIKCGDVRDGTTGATISIQRYEAYSAFVNFNNFLNAIYEALFDAGTIGIADTGEIVTTFFTNPKPDVTFDKILNIIGPLLGIFSGVVGAAGLGVASGLLGAVGGTLGAISNSATAQGQPVADKRFDEFSTINDFIGQYLKAISAGVEDAYEAQVGNASSVSWYGSTLVSDNDIAGKNGIFGGGDWADNDHTQNVQRDMLDNFVRVVTYKSINYAWTDSQAFIMYVPYGVDVKDVHGNDALIKVDQAYCQTLLKNDDDKILTNCDAPGGMARLISGSADTKEASDARPMGYNHQYNVIDSESFSTHNAIAGSVASWQAGDFKYDISTAFTDQLNPGNGRLSSDTLNNIANLKIAASSPGFFNIPVCKVLDLRGFPPASGTPCGCEEASAIGGKQGSTATFKDNVDEKIVTWLRIAGAQDTTLNPVTGQSIYGGGGCPGDLFTG